jgi:hypothetical protein
VDSLIALLKALRKLLAYLGNLVPPVQLPALLRRRLDLLADRPGCRRVQTWLAGWRVTRALRLVWQRFVWRDFSGDRVVLSSLPLDVAAPLRTGLTFVALALLLIFYSGHTSFPPVDASNLSTEVKQVSAVTLGLAVLGLALGMAGLLAGAARSNYAAFLSLLALCTFLVLGVAGRSQAVGLHGLLGLSAVGLALVQAESFVRGRPLRSFVATAALSYLGGIVLWRTSPLHLIPEPYLGLVGLGLWTGAVLSRSRAAGHDLRSALRDLLFLALFFAALRGLLIYGPVLADRLGGGAGPPPPMRHTVALACLSAALHHLLQRAATRELVPLRRLFAGCFALALLFLLEMGRHLGQAGLLQAVSQSLAYATTSLWMVWYFMAVGIAYKLLKETRTLVDALEILAPGRLLSAVALLLLLALLSLSFGASLLDLGLAGWLPQVLSLRLARLGLWTEKLPFVWHETLSTLRPVLLGVVGALVYLRRRRLLDRARILALAFVTLLAFMGIYEYHFELYSFARSGTHAPRTAALFFFGLWLLWLVYSVGMRTAQGDSPRFSRVARTALFVGLLALVSSSLHLQAVVKPRELADQTFLEFFFGLVNIGLPYFLYVYLFRRYPKNPLPVHLIAGAFFLGGAAALLAALYGKLAASGYTAAGLWQTVRHIEEQIVSTGQFPADVALPARWGSLSLRVLFEELLKAACTGAVVFRLGELERLRREGPVYAVAIGLGFASAAIIPPWFPLLPTRVISALYPLETFREVDLRLAAHHLLHLLSALLYAAVLVVALRQEAGWRRRVVAGLGAALVISTGVRAAAAVLDGTRRAYLTSTGLDWIYLLAPLLLGFGLFLWLERRIAHRLRPAEDRGAPQQHALVPDGHRRAGLAVAVLALTVTAVFLAHRGRMIPVDVTLATLARPATWQAERPPPGNLVSLGREPRPGERLRVLVSRERVPREVGLRQAAETLDRITRRQLSDLKIEGAADTRVGGASALARMLRFTLPMPGGWRMDYGCQQVLVRSGDEVLVLAYISAMPQFKRYHDDFRRMLQSVRLHGG